MTENKMSPKEYLSQAMYIDQRIDSKLQQVATLRESAAKVTATLTDMPRSASPNPQAMENTIVKIIDLENEFNRDVDRLVDLKAEVKRVISRLSSPDQKLVLELLYLCFKPWSEIMETLGISGTSVYRVHGEALKNIVVPEKTGVNAVERESFPVLGCRLSKIRLQGQLDSGAVRARPGCSFWSEKTQPIFVGCALGAVGLR